MLDDEEIILQRVDNELNSLDDYVTQGFIDERKVRNGINQWLSNATSWEEPAFDMNYSGTDRDGEKNPRQEMWLLYHEDNEQYAVEGVDTLIGGTTRRSRSDNMIDYINDPYSISFVSFHNRGSVEALTLYQRLRDMTDRGQLDPMAGKYRDYRQAFALVAMWLLLGFVVMSVTHTKRAVSHTTSRLLQSSSRDSSAGASCGR